MTLPGLEARPYVGATMTARESCGLSYGQAQQEGFGPAASYGRSSNLLLPGRPFGSGWSG